MNEELARERSPRAPVVPLQKAVEFIGKLHAEFRRGAATPETAARAMGFQTVHGGVNTLFAGLREYGLIDRPQGKVALTPLAVKILHPLSDEQRHASIVEAALSPKLFAALIRDFGDSSMPVLESHLVQSGFTPERAKQVAKVFLDNKSFAKLEPGSKVDEPKDDPDADAAREKAENEEKAAALAAAEAAKKQTQNQKGRVETQGRNVLAQYQVPLGANEATLVFTGDALVPEDFDALLDYVALFKSQFVRRLKSAPQSAPQIVAVPPSKEVADAYFTQYGRPLTKSEYDPDSQD
jgi:hypothetical protein